MKFFTPNQFAIEVCIIYGKIIRSILKTGDHELAIHEVSKWVYLNGSDKVIDLWKLSENGK